MPLNCPKCKAEAPDGKAYCADCGSPLDANGKLQAIVQDAMRDALPIAIADKAIERFWFYAKLIGIPSGLVLLVLGGWSISSVRDALAKVQTASQQAIGNIQTTGQQAVAKLQEQALKDAGKIDDATNDVIAKLSKVENNKNLSAEFSRVWGKLQDTDKQLEIAKTKTQQYQEEIIRLRSTVANSPTASGTLAGLSALNAPTGDSSHIAALLGNSPTPPGLTSSSFLPFLTVTIGQENDYVKTIQTKLKDAGCYHGEITGKFDQDTSEAVIRFKNVPTPFSLTNSPTSLTSPVSNNTKSGDVDYLTWFDLTNSSFPRRCY